jgi:hypothetical protein
MTKFPRPKYAICFMCHKRWIRRKMIGEFSERTSHYWHITCYRKRIDKILKEMDKG